MNPPTPPTQIVRAPAAALGVRLLQLMPAGTLDDFRAVVHPRAVNREASHEPPASRVPGPHGFHATALWLRGAFADLRVDIHHVAVDDDLVVIHNTMRGTQHGPMVFYDEQARVADVFPSRGGSYATTQTHWMRVEGGLVVEHWANRDDLGTAKQLRWVPPSPPYLLRARLARRAARRASAPPAMQEPARP